MWVCEHCGAEFNEPKEYYETHGLPSPPYELFRECPECSSTYIYEGSNNDDRKGI